MEREDVLRALDETPGWLGAALGQLPGESTARRGSGDAWSVAEIIVHLRAADAIISHRMWQVLARDGALLSAYDERAWGGLISAAAMSLADQVESFRLRRAELVALLRSLSDERWVRSGQHEVRGRVTLLDLGRDIAGHEAEHRSQMDTVVAALTS